MICEGGGGRDIQFLRDVESRGWAGCGYHNCHSGIHRERDDKGEVHDPGREACSG